METQDHILRSSKPTKSHLPAPDPQKSFKDIRTALKAIGVTLAVAILIYCYFKNRGEL